MAIDDSIDPTSYSVPEGLTLLNLNDTGEVISWIKDNAKEI